MKLIKKIFTMLGICVLALSLTVLTKADSEEKIRILVLNENGETVNVTGDIMSDLLEQLRMDVPISSDFEEISQTLQTSCTHIPCNQVEDTLSAHVRISSTECWVYTKRVLICRCCGAAVKSLSDWKLSYSHKAHF